MLNQLFLRNKLPKQLVQITRCFADIFECGLKEVLREKIPLEREKVKKFRLQHGKTKVGDVTIDMMYGGMRGIPGIVWDVSQLDPEEGIRFRGLTISECYEKLPRKRKQPQPEAMFWLLLTGDVPTLEQMDALSEDLAIRGDLPPFIMEMVDNFPKALHPMVQFSAAITAMSGMSIFASKMRVGMKKTEHWEWAYEDSMNLLANLPILAASIYRNMYRNRDAEITVYDNQDWTTNFVLNLGGETVGFIDFMRLYLSIHCDHEGGNVSAHTMHLVGSALADPYLAFAAAMNGLAGPLHGLANQEVLIFLRDLQIRIGHNPDESEISEFCIDYLKTGRVIPGYGHAVLRKTDPRFTCQREFALEHLPNDELCQLVSKLFNVVPDILKATGKVQNPWPNIDAHSGVLLNHYGLQEIEFYTVLFGVSRALGILAQTIWSRALGFPIERPRSFTTDNLMKLVAKKTEAQDLKPQIEISEVAEVQLKEQAS